MAATACLVLPFLVAFASIAPVTGVAAMVFALGVFLLSWLGPHRLGVVAIFLAFFTAPMYRGLEGLTANFSTPTDILVVIAILLLLPGLARRPIQPSLIYSVGLFLIVLTGLGASLAAANPRSHLFDLTQWLVYLALLPLVVAWWQPGIRVVVGLLWAYIAGQMLSIAVAFVQGPVEGDRYQGLSHHPNAFAMGGVVTLAIVFFHFHHYRDVRVRVLLSVVGLAAAISINMSGSRAAVGVAAGLVLLIPIVERAALTGFVLALLGSATVVLLPTLAGLAGEGTALSRLMGQGTAAGSDIKREAALGGGVNQFLESPVVGSGLVDVGVVHNLYVEVAVGLGIVGLLGYLMVLVVLARPLLSTHPLRRLAYITWAMLGIALSIPSLWDRTIWVPMCLTILPALESTRSAYDGFAPKAVKAVS